MRWTAFSVIVLSLLGAAIATGACDDWSTPPWTRTTTTAMGNWYAIDVGPDFTLAVGSIDLAYYRTPYLVAFGHPPGFPNETPVILPLLSQMQITDFAENVCVNGTFAYLTSTGPQLTIVDVSDPAAMTVDHTMALAVACRDLLLDESRELLFSAEWDAVRIYSTAQPDNPTLVGSVVAPQSMALARDGHLIYVACASLGLRVIDTTDPELPVELANTFVGGNVRDVALWQNRALLVGPTVGLVSVDVANPASPIYLGQVPCEGEAASIAIKAGYAYIRSLNIRHPEFGFNENKVHLFRLLATMLPKFENSFFTRIESSIQAGALIVAGDVVLLADDDILTANIQCAPVAGVPELPEPQLALGWPWPNPFNPAVELTFRLPHDHAGRLSVYDLRGQKVHTLWAGQGTGLDQTFVWRGQTVQGNKAPSGTYLFVLQDDKDGGRRIQRGSLVK